MTMCPYLLYCCIGKDNRPAIYVKRDEDGNGSAWWFYDGAWRPAPRHEVFTKAAVIGKTAFEARFPRIPPLMLASTR